MNASVYMKPLPNSSQMAYEDLIRFLADFSILMGKHIEVVSRTLVRSSESLATGVEEIQSSSRLNFEKADQFQLKNHETKKFDYVRISKSDPLFADPVGFARPVSETMAMHMAGIKVLESSLEQFMSSILVLQSVDHISNQRLIKANDALKALSDALQESLVIIRMHGSLSDEFVECMKLNLLAVLEVDGSKQQVNQISDRLLGR